MADSYIIWRPIAVADKEAAIDAVKRYGYPSYWTIRDEKPVFIWATRHLTNEAAFRAWNEKSFETKLQDWDQFYRVRWERALHGLEPPHSVFQHHSHGEWLWP